MRQEGPGEQAGFWGLLAPAATSATISSPGGSLTPLLWPGSPLIPKYWQKQGQERKELSKE